MVEKFKLNLIVGFTILLVTIWLIWTHGVWEWTGNLLLLGATVLIVWALLVREKKQAKLLEFFLKSLVVSYVVTSVIWFAQLSITTPLFYAYFNSVSLMNQLVLVALPLSLLPVAVSVIIYGIFRIKLKAWEIFLPSWYVSVFVILIVWSIQWTPPPEEYIYPVNPSGSLYTGMTAIYTLLLLSLLAAAICTIVYIKYKKPQNQKST